MNYLTYIKLKSSLANGHLILPLFIYRLTDDEARKNWEEYGNPDGPTGDFFHLLFSDFHV